MKKFIVDYVLLTQDLIDKYNNLDDLVNQAIQQEETTWSFFNSISQGQVKTKVISPIIARLPAINLTSEVKLIKPSSII